MNWKKLYKEPKPGDKVKVLTLVDDSPEFEEGEILTLLKVYEVMGGPHKLYGKRWAVEEYGNPSTNFIYETEFEKVL